MIVRDFNEEKLTARRIETSNWESVRLLLKNDGMGFSEPRRVFRRLFRFQRRELDGLERAPWSASMDHLGLVEAVDRFGV
ncbi:hypothetical protein B5V02_20290 [Mesorhizobium kowhaii]|uniref:Uncharacterized protein n=1 Tax=Mesorhizobium kowhaii TaxID=1300272 RepID=A0A2W7CSK3_9HYPH|nr:hypothetical protein B5V02_20290 [Mesorhizobium kowhaii]